MNLIICLTPLQALIAEKIIEKTPNEEFIAVILAYQKNSPKYQYAYESLKDKAKKVYFLEIVTVKGRELLLLLLLLRLTVLFKINHDIRKITKIYMASIDSLWGQYILQLFQKQADFYTFDDGTANIDLNSFLYKEKISKKAKLKRKILNIKLTLPKIKSMIKKHYTIYQNLPNIVEKERLVYLPLFKENIQTTKPTKVIKIFLGQPIFEQFAQGYQKNINITQKAIDLVKPDYYLPHPREHYHIDNIDYIRTELIAETYLLNQLKENKDIKYELYSFFSTSLVNLIDIQNIDVIAIYFPEIPQIYQDIYKIFDQLKIRVIK